MSPIFNNKTTQKTCGLSSVGRAPALQAGGQDFDYPSLQTFFSCLVFRFFDDLIFRFFDFSIKKSFLPAIFFFACGNFRIFQFSKIFTNTLISSQFCVYTLILKFLNKLGGSISMMARTPKPSTFRNSEKKKVAFEFDFFPKPPKKMRFGNFVK